MSEKSEEKSKGWIKEALKIGGSSFSITEKKESSILVWKLSTGRIIQAKKQFLPERTTFPLKPVFGEMSI